MADQTAADLTDVQADLLGELRRGQTALDALSAHHANESTIALEKDKLKEKHIIRINTVGSLSGLTPLLTACLIGSDADVQLLLSFGADPVVE